MLKFKAYLIPSLIMKLMCLMKFQQIVIAKNILQNKERCGVPEIPFNSKTIPHKNGYIKGETVTFECDDGFHLHGNKNITCAESLNWEPETPYCEENVANGRLVYFNGYSTVLLTADNQSSCKRVNFVERGNVHVASWNVYFGEIVPIRAIRLKFKTNITKGISNLVLGKNMKSIIRCNEHSMEIALTTSTNYIMEIICSDFQVGNVNIGIFISNNTEGMFELCGLEVYRTRGNNCHIPEIPLYCGLIYNGKGEPGSKAHYNANSGFTLIKNSIRTCVDGKWEGEAPKCSYINMDCDTFGVKKTSIITSRNATQKKYNNTCDKQPQDDGVAKCFEMLHVNLHENIFTVKHSISLKHDNVTKSIDEVNDGNTSTCVLVSSGVNSLIQLKIELNESRIVSHTVILLHVAAKNQPLTFLVTLRNNNKSGKCAKFDVIFETQDDDFLVACFSHDRFEVKDVEIILNSTTTFQVEMCELLFFSINIYKEGHVNRSMILLLSLSATMTIILCLIFRRYCRRRNCSYPSLEKDKNMTSSKHMTSKNMTAPCVQTQRAVSTYSTYPSLMTNDTDPYDHVYETIPGDEDYIEPKSVTTDVQSEPCTTSDNLQLNNSLLIINSLYSESMLPKTDSRFNSSNEMQFTNYDQKDSSSSSNVDEEGYEKVRASCKHVYVEIIQARNSI